MNLKRAMLSANQTVSEISSTHSCRHAAITMDGNGRWAKWQGKIRAFGHKASAKSVRRAVSFAANNGIEVLTLYVPSSESWSRPAQEVSVLMELLVWALDSEVKSLHRHSVRLQVIDDTTRFNARLQERIRKAEALIANNTGLMLNTTADYGGCWDITQGVRPLAKQVQDETLLPEEITEEILSQQACMHELAPVDLVIRTGGEHRINNFLIWQIAYAELYFTDVLWPDFAEQDFEDVPHAFVNRERRFGGIEPGSSHAQWGLLSLRYRLISAFVLIPVAIVALFLLSLMGFAIMALMVCILAVQEWGRLSGFISTLQWVWLAVPCGLLLAAMLFLLPKYHYDVHQPMMEGSLWALSAWWIVAPLLVLSHPASAAFWCRSKVLRLIFGILTIISFFWGMLASRAWHYTDNHYGGAVWLLYVMILAWGTGSGAYMFGKMFDKHKLAPKVSSGKTWQGFFDDLLTAAVILWAYGVRAHLDVIPTVLLVCSVVAALVSALGDLAESMSKREAGTKDSGHLVPGYGGILDRIDNLTVAVPVFACLPLLIFRMI